MCVKAYIKHKNQKMTNCIPNIIIEKLVKRKYEIHILGSSNIIAFLDKEESFSNISIEKKSCHVFSISYTVVLGDKVKTVCQNVSTNELSEIIDNIGKKRFRLSLFSNKKVKAGRKEDLINNPHQTK